MPLDLRSCSLSCKIPVRKTWAGQSECEETRDWPRNDSVGLEINDRLQFKSESLPPVTAGCSASI